MDGANPLLVSTSESDDDSEDDGTAVQLGAVAVAAAAEAAIVAAGADQWVPVAATSDGCSLLLIPPCDLAQL
eukprot:COSAG06_NODE_6637_length_2845_cov_1.736708_1_plen_71_part_10